MAEIIRFTPSFIWLGDKFAISEIFDPIKLVTTKKMCTFFLRVKNCSKRSGLPQSLIDWNLGVHYFTQSLKNKYNIIWNCNTNSSIQQKLPNGTPQNLVRLNYSQFPLFSHTFQTSRSFRCRVWATGLSEPDVSFSSGQSARVIE